MPRTTEEAKQRRKELDSARHKANRALQQQQQKLQEQQQQLQQQQQQEEEKEKEQLRQKQAREKERSKKQRQRQRQRQQQQQERPIRMDDSNEGTPRARRRGLPVKAQPSPLHKAVAGVVAEFNPNNASDAALASVATMVVGVTNADAATEQAEAKRYSFEKKESQKDIFYKAADTMSPDGLKQAIPGIFDMNNNEDGDIAVDDNDDRKMSAKKPAKRKWTDSAAATASAAVGASSKKAMGKESAAATASAAVGASRKKPPPGKESASGTGASRKKAPRAKKRRLLLVLL